MPSKSVSPVAEVVDQVVADLAGQPPPRATYRLQLNHTFTFADATAIVPFLARLGVSHLYASPIFKAEPGSLHGYDVVDYSELNPELGTRADFETLVETVHGHGLNLLLDFVPNHMGIANGHNAWWQDVLENGEASPYAGWFDIDWTPLKPELRGRVLLPILGDQYGNVLEAGQLRLACADGAFTVHYYDTPLPVSPPTYPLILRRALLALEAALPPEDIDLLEYQSLITALERLDEMPADATELRLREQAVARHRLAALVERSGAIASALEETIAAINGTKAKPRSFDALDELLQAQAYRVAFWRVAGEEINYRRFFAINTLAAIRQEEPAVFAASHELVLELLAVGMADGLRIDHIDGLHDPAGYLRDLQRGYVTAVVARRFGELTDEEAREVALAVDRALDRIAAEGGRWPLYIVVEKVLEAGETLPENWHVAGTTGYEFAQEVTELFVDGEQRRAFDRIYQRITGERNRFHELALDTKRHQMRTAFTGELNVLVNRLSHISEQDRHSRDLTQNALRQVLREIVACFPVYRTYTTCEDAPAPERAARYVERAVTEARRRNPAFDPTVFDFVRRVLLLEPGGESETAVEARSHECGFTMKAQQFTGPVMAKGLEDTAFYLFNRLVSLNEVGGDPSRFGSSDEEFHRFSRGQRRRWPHQLLASSTHDTKRSEDVRARINVLSEIPTEWRAAINRWTRMNRRFKTMIEGALAPTRNDEYLIYQTLVGTWPLTPNDSAGRTAYVHRIQEYIVKAVREGGQNSNWLNPNEPYEQALHRFVAGLLTPRRSTRFPDDCSAFVASILTSGLTNALAQQALKLTAPGVPDTYQGTAIWDDSLVDPDNRRSVDFAHRETLLASFDAEADAAAFWDERTDGRIKLFLTQRLLAARHADPSLFAAGDYTARTVAGPEAGRLLAFSRRFEGREVLAVVSRLAHALARDQARGAVGPVWDETAIQIPEGGEYENLLTGDRVATGAGGVGLAAMDVLAQLPVAVLRRVEKDGNV